MPRRLCTVLPSAVTLTSLLLGISAIVVLPDQHFLLAALMILTGSVLDMLDGQLAARLNAVTQIGKQLDSLADMVTFGVAPTIFVYHLMLLVGVMHPVALAAALTFALAGAYRLARFNTLPSDRSAYFVGMPIPVSSIFLIVGSFWRHWTLNIWWVLIVLLVSYLMVSPFPYPKVKHLAAAPNVLWMLLLAFALICWRIAGWQVIPFSLLLLYAVSGPLFAVSEPAQQLLQKES